MIKSLRILMQPMGRLLISLLISKWGIPLLLLGMTALAGSTAAYLRSSAGPQTRPGVSGPTAVTISTAHGSRCWRDFVPATPHTACDLSGR